MSLACALFFLEDMKTIAQAIGDVKNLSFFISALEQVKLIDALNQTGPFTVFAPSDDAFWKAQEEIPFDDAKLKKLLLRHVVQGENITHGQFSDDMKTFDTMNDGDKVMIWKKNGKKQVQFKNVVASDDHADMEVANGAIHIISNVLVTRGEFCKSPN